MRKTIKVEITLKHKKRRVIYVDLKSNQANGVLKRLTAKYGLNVRTA
jgi:subtilisin-like proprotein convertase family protein